MANSNAIPIGLRHPRTMVMLDANVVWIIRLMWFSKYLIPSVHIFDLSRHLNNVAHIFNFGRHLTTPVQVLDLPRHLIISLFRQSLLGDSPIIQVCRSNDRGNN